MPKKSSKEFYLMEHIEKEFLRPKDVAAIFGVTQETLRNWRRQGILPYFRINNTIRFSCSDVLECLSKFKKNERRNSKRRINKFHDSCHYTPIHANCCVTKKGETSSC